MLDSIGSVKDIVKMRKEREAWAKDFDCSKDKICQCCCMDFIVAYNKEISKIKGE